jgi:DNA-binding MarR family transcriptional regulator
MGISLNPSSQSSPNTSVHQPFYVPGQYKPEQSLGYLMKKVLSSILLEADRRLSRFDLTYVQWLPLYKLAQDQDITMACLARELQIDPAAMSRSLDRIETKGLIHRKRSVTDRRVVHLELTPEGREIAEGVTGVLADVLNDHLQGFEHKEWSLLITFLQRVLVNGEALRAQEVDLANT